MVFNFENVHDGTAAGRTQLPVLPVTLSSGYYPREILCVYPCPCGFPLGFSISCQFSVDFPMSTHTHAARQIVYTNLPLSVNESEHVCLVPYV